MSNVGKKNFSKLKNKGKITHKKVKEIFKKKLVRNVFSDASGTAASQVIILLFSPIITRLYGPEAFGALGIFMSTLSIFNPVAAFAYPIAIVLPKDDEEAKGLMRLSGYISLITSGSVALLLLLMGKETAKLLRLEDITKYLLFIPIAMIFSVAFQVMQQWLIRKKQFKIKAKISVLQALIINVAKLGIGFFYPVATVLIVVSTFGHAVHSILLVWGAGLKSIFKKKNSEEEKKFVSLKALSKKYYDFPLYRAPETLVNGISESLPILMLSAFFGPAVAGFYAIGKKVLQLPIKLIGDSIGDVFYPRIAEAANNKENISEILKKANFILAAVGLLPCLVIIIFGPILFGFVFGTEWIVAGEYARWMTLWLYFVLITRPSIKTLPVIGAQKFHLFFTIATIIARLCGLIIGGYLFRNDLMAVILYSMFGSLMYMLLAIITVKKAKCFMIKKEQ
jgi:O-antigen/teichoic acid export membrane protein